MDLNLENCVSQKRRLSANWFVVLPALLMMSLSSGATAQDDGSALTAERRAELLSFYPCGKPLPDAELVEMSDWANGMKLDPCMLDASEFVGLFLSGKAEQRAADVNIVHDAYDALPPSMLFMQQVLIIGRDKASGVWDLETEARFADLLRTYHAIGGVGPDWGVRTTDDVPRFIRWVIETDYTTTMGIEVPD
jgi:hypothetical protein